MDKEQAYKIGLAFKLGMIYAKGKAHARKLTTDKAEWITVHPNGKENKGRPALIDSTTGQVLGGMGGKFNGKHISKAHTNSTPKEIKKQLSGISKEKLIKLRDKLNKTDANELFKTKENQSKNNPKEIDDLLKDFNQEELKSLRDKLNNTDFNNLFKKDTQKNDSNSKEINDLFKGISQEKLKALKDKLDQTDEKGLINQTVNKQTANNQPAENQTINKQNKVSFNGYDFENVSEAKDFLYDAEKNIRGHKEDIATNTTKLKQVNKDLAKLQTLDRFYQDYKKDNPLFEKSFTEYLKDNKANYKGIKANELPDLRSSKYWGGGYQDSERAINTLKNAYERVSDNLKRKNTEIRDLNRNIEYAKERIPRLQKLIKIGNETLSKIEK